MKSILIFYPDKLETNTIGLLQGVTLKSDEDLSFYITTPNIYTSGSTTIGYCSENTPEGPQSGDKSEWLHINTLTKDFSVLNANLNEYNENLICVSYDYETFRKCDQSAFTSLKYGDHLNTLCEIINRNVEWNKRSFRYLFLMVIVNVLSFILKFLDKVSYLMKYSTTISHVDQSLHTLRSTLLEIINKKASVRTTNTMLSKFIDFLCGYLVLYVFFKYESLVFENLNGVIEWIIENLRKLLTFLMGSPIGLKLNHSFNQTLGSFFFYHIFLWRTFMQFIKPHLYSVFYILMVPASFGLSYQAAVIEDLIKFCTIHVYCIYIYAARLYGLQMYAIVALWRLFIGRKYNPLRNRVDSYQYNHNQLFIGTLTFTILLFLLPTTLLYYVVFATFRLLLKTINYILSCIRISLQHLPIYSVLLWLQRSPKVAGLVVLLSQQSHQSLHIKLETLPLNLCIKSMLPITGFTVPKVNFKEGLNKIFVGKLL